MSTIGAPSSYTQAVADEIVRRLSEGEPLAEICRDDGMPQTRTVSDWKRAQPEFGERFAQARKDGYDRIANRARKTARGLKKAAGGDSTGDVQRDKLIIETDLKLLAKWDPSRYGERLALANDPDHPLIGKSDEQIDARINELLAKRGRGDA